MSWTSQKRKRTSFIPFILSEGKICNIFVLSQYIVYWIHLQSIHIFTYQKTLLHTLFCLLLKSPKAFSVSLIRSIRKVRLETPDFRWAPRPVSLSLGEIRSPRSLKFGWDLKLETLNDNSDLRPTCHSVGPRLKNLKLLKFRTKTLYQDLFKKYLQNLRQW